jgi:tRNA 2-thiocytidine biosynthesis protein TtcA
MDKAVWEYGMFDDRDNVLVAVSGGMDSMALLDLLSLRLPIYGEELRLHAVYVDLGFGVKMAERCALMEAFFDQTGVAGRIVRTDIGPLAHGPENRENPCFLCSRIRRKKIFEAAESLECRKIIFGHHKDDIVETLLLNMIFGREISTMSPKLGVFKGKYTIVRPLVYLEEDLLKKYGAERGLPSFEQDCPTDGNSKRQVIKDLLGRLESEFVGSRENIFQSMRRVKKDYLL